MALEISSGGFVWCRNFDTSERIQCCKSTGITWTDRVKNDEVLQIVKEERDILLTIKRRKAKWIGQILRRNWLVKHVIIKRSEGKTRKKT
jgi:hypothetical protein